MNKWKTAIPVLVSAGLIAWLVVRVNPDRLAQAAAELNWALLVPVTALMVLCLYIWDAVCVRALFSNTGAAIRYRQVLHARGLSYLVGVINYELGQGALAWSMSTLQGVSVVSGLARIVLLAYHDLIVLLGLGLLGSTILIQPETYGVRVFSAVGMAALLAAPVVILLLPVQIRRLVPARWLPRLESWNLKRSLELLALRVTYFSIFILYVTIALRICQIPVGQWQVLSSVPIVLMADALPSVSGLGTRDTALQLLIQTPRREVLAAMSLIWSSGLIVGRLGIGLFHLWLARGWGLAAGHSPVNDHDTV
jgi:hypothetical protein